MDAQALLSRYRKLKSDKEVYDTLYQQTADYFLPFKADFNRLYSAGEKRNRELYTQEPQHAIDISSSSMIGLIANPASRWFYIEMVDEELNRDAEVSAWCEKAGQEALNYISRPEAMFYQNLKSTIEDALCFGTFSMFVNPDDTIGIEFGSRSVHSFVVAENHKGEVDTVMNEIKMTARQILQKTEEGWEASDKIRKIADSKPDEELTVIHIVMPRADAKEGKKNPKVMPWAGYYVCEKFKEILFETGYQEMPQPVARWRKTVNEVYGRSQAMIALADAQTLNVAMRMFMFAVEKQVEPNVFLPNDTNPQKVDLTAGGVTFYDATKGRPEFYAGTGDLGTVFTFIQGLEDKIRRILYVDQLQMQGNYDMTATEVLQRQNEKARLLAPALGRFQSELLSPLLTRAINILIREGRLEAPPQKILNSEYQIGYTTPITRAQRMVDMDNLMQSVQTIASMAQFKPDVLQKINTDNIVDEIMDIFGTTGVMKLSDEEVQAIREEANEAMETQMALQTAQQGAGIAKDAAQAGLIE